MSLYYIDTCSLVWRYINGNLTSDVNALIDNTWNQVYTNEITILEWSSALGSTILSGAMLASDFEPNEMALFTDIASEKIKIFRSQRSIERARNLIKYVAVVNGRQLRTVDAIHLASGIELSVQMGTVVEFVTSDIKLNHAASYPVFSHNLSPQYLAP